MKTILVNAFSLQMIDDKDLSRVRFESIDKPDNLNEMESAIGHEDTANVLGVKFNRSNVKLTDGVELIVAQLTGGRLPEGSTTLPDGFKFKWIKVSLV